MKTFLFLLLLIVTPAEAKQLGNFGHTFDIIEEDLLEIIQKKLNLLEKEGVIQKHQHLIQEKMKKQIKRPTPIEGVIKTKKPRIFTYDPSIRIPYDLKDHTGNIFVKAGTVVNPLDTHSLKHPLVFIDGDDKTQVKWAVQKPNHKIILVKGSPFELIDLYSAPFYFDQGGRLVKKLGIHQVPAQVSEDNKMLRIEEILVEEK